jgi:hypothetical protein
LGERLLSPAGIGWIVAGSIGLLLVGSFLLGPGREDPPADVSAADQPARTAESVDVADAGPAADPQPTVEERLLTLSRWIEAWLDEHGTIPSTADRASELPPGERLSWQSILVAEQIAPADVPQWERAWDDPLNDRFVRRRVDPLLNPNVEQPTGIHGYPATHFAGVAGVGADAAELAKRHPRAGIFGHDRATTRADISDGLANTMMVAGVQQELESWAANGAGTVRPFAREPYINGPDGFGTGQEEGMHVLMADGRVRFLSRDTDPAIIRRMAAMADGLPLDPSVSGEPGDSESVGVPQAADAAAHPRMPPDPFGETGAPDRPIDVLLAPDPPLVDVAGVLEFPVAEYAQATPVSLLDLLYQWEEMAGIPIDATPLDEDRTALDRLRQNVTLNMTDTTLGEILTKLLAEGGLRYEVGPYGVRLHNEDPADADTGAGDTALPGNSD